MCVCVFACVSRLISVVVFCDNLVASFIVCNVCISKHSVVFVCADVYMCGVLRVGVYVCMCVCVCVCTGSVFCEWVFKI